MGVLPDWMIRNGQSQASGHCNVKIDPFADREKRPGVISYGLTSYGYDLRLGNDFMVPRQHSLGGFHGLDPKVKYDDSHEAVAFCEPFWLAAGASILGVSLEEITIPRECIGIVLGKSTYARCYVLVNVTPLEPEWCGYVTMEISNVGRTPVKIYPREGIAQVVFLASAASTCEVSYADKGGIYQHQPGVPVQAKVAE